MSKDTCCKAFCVKITYTLIIGAIFVVALLVSFDVYLQSRMFQSNQFDGATVSHTCANQDAYIKSSMFNLLVGYGYYNPATECFSEKETGQESFNNYYDGIQTTVFVNTTVNGSYVLKEKVIKCVSQEFINGDTNSIMYYLTASCAWGGLILGILILLCIWTCCVDWCRCCCCRCLCCQKKEGIVSDSHVYV
ncbi:Hypothetical_protein [Hexamita inflata]|uniref:Hypothetical_protein n=1 Tax=Hexamita inflata TaxID=28002 RepID=A0AA86USR6_9EUKA|nr:Hypothetical protein HINF_LOCUS36138 [Hexamita inflata]